MLHHKADLSLQERLSVLRSSSNLGLILYQFSQCICSLASQIKRVQCNGTIHITSYISYSQFCMGMIVCQFNLMKRIHIIFRSTGLITFTSMSARLCLWLHQLSGTNRGIYREKITDSWFLIAGKNINMKTVYSAKDVLLQNHHSPKTWNPHLQCLHRPPGGHWLKIHNYSSLSFTCFYCKLLLPAPSSGHEV